MRDPTSEATLRDFLSRLGEWEGGKDAAGRESVRALVLESIPAGPAQGPLRRLSLEWFEANRGTAIVGGMIVGGVVGVVLAGAAVAVAAARRRH